MNRDQLAHVLQAACRIVEDSGIVVLGSQAVLGSYDADALPESATRSIEADLAFWNDPDDAKSDEVDGSIGELSAFHETFGYYAQGVSVTTAVLPEGWRERCVPFDDADPSGPVCIELHDLVVSKLVAGRPKDLEFATALLAAGLVEVDVLRARADELPGPRAVADRVHAAITRCARAPEA